MPPLREREEFHAKSSGRDYFTRGKYRVYNEVIVIADEEKRVQTLTHYVVVRRDLPFGVILSMIAHAAGESFYKLATCTMTATGDLSLNLGSMASGGYCPPSSVVEHQTFSLGVGGLIPSAGSTFDPSATVAVVLGARNQARLVKLGTALHAEMVPSVEIRETDGDFAGQLMAIGIVPGDKAFLAPFVRDFHMFREMNA